MTWPVAHAALWAAFWIAWLRFTGSPLNRSDAARFGISLVAGVIFAHLGWWALGPARGPEPLAALFNPWQGYSLLFVPIGPLLIGVGLRDPTRARELRARACLALTPALAVARLGCLFAGCCHGIPTSMPWGVPSSASALRVHPTPLYEIAAFTVLCLLLSRLPLRWVTPAFLVGFGLVRCAVLPWRAESGFAGGCAPASLVAGAWIVLGLAASVRAARPRHDAC